jgi:hypothetical protein
MRPNGRMQPFQCRINETESVSSYIEREVSETTNSGWTIRIVQRVEGTGGLRGYVRIIPMKAVAKHRYVDVDS